MPETGFILFFILSIYSYLLYPVILQLMASVRPRPWDREDKQPSISLIISVYNEELNIKKKLLNSLDLDYPKSLFEIIVVSDASSDRTTEIVKSLNHNQIKLLEFKERRGKTACLNDAVAEAMGDLIVFSDANSIFPKDTLKKMARNFSDSRIGLVTGWTRYMDSKNNEEITGLYSRFEKYLKEKESVISSCVGADGAIFAIRKKVYKKLKEDDINDFVIPLQVIDQRKRVVLDGEIFCYEETSAETGSEFRRQVRITNRTLRAIFRNIHLLNPFRSGSFAFFLLSHKILRFMAPFFIIIMFTLNLFLIDQVVFQITFLFMLFLLFSGAFIKMKFPRSRFSQIINLLFLTLTAQLVAWGRFVSGKSDTMWKPVR